MGEGLKATVQRLAIPLIACGLAVGILLGLLLGWLVWPVQWYDTDPSDLRLQHQVDYVTLVSDSLAVTGDIEAARQRLAELTDGDTTWHQIADLVEKVAAESEAEGDLATALRLRRMAQATGLPLATSTGFSPRAGSGRPLTLLYVAVGVAIVGLGVGGYLYGQSKGQGAFARSRLASSRARPRATSPAGWLDRAAPSSPRGAPPVRPSTLDLQGDEDEDLLLGDGVADDGLDDDLDDYDDDWDDEEVGPDDTVVVDLRDVDVPAPEAGVAAPAAVARPGNGDAFLGDRADYADDADDDGETDEGLDDWDDEGDDVPGDTAAEAAVEAEGGAADAPAPRAVERGVAARVEAGGWSSSSDIPPDALGLFEAEYILGDDDFDSSFTIESPDGEFLGECGVGMTDVLDVDGGVQRADAFEVWLFDKGDIRTVTKVLVSEQAYRDEARSARLSAKGELVIAQPGLDVTLETLSLRVTVTVRDCEFAEGSDGPEGHFVRLDLEMLAESSDAVP